MRFILSFVLLLALATAGRSSDAPQAKAAAALALAKSQRERAGAAAPAPAPAPAPVQDQSRVQASLMLEKVRRDREATAVFTDMVEATSVATREQKVIFIWVGMPVDPGVRAAFPAAVHCTVERWKGRSTPRLLVGTSSGVSDSYWLFDASQVSAGIVSTLRTLMPEHHSALALPPAAAVCTSRA